MRVYLDNNYPKNLAEALQLLHRLQVPQDFEIVRTQHFDETNIDNSVVFLFDRSKKGIDIVTEKHFEAGYKVIAFKISSTDTIDFFKLSLITLKLWPNILDLIGQVKEPFIFTYNYKGKSLTKVKGN
jgi:hypothetical protein